MAFAWVYESNFETGDLTEWDTANTQDTGSQLDVVHYSELAKFPWPTATPYTGAYCLRAQLTGGTADAYVSEGDIDVAADAVRHVRFNVWFSPSFDATADDTVNLLELRASGTAEAVVGFRYVATTDVINIGIGETAPTSWGSEDIVKGVWYTIEMQVSLDAGTNDDGAIDLYITRVGAPPTIAVSATQVSSLNQGAVTEGVLGVQDHLATTTGTILFDNLVVDDARVYPDERYPTDTIYLTKSGHAFVGPGVIEKASLLSGAGTDNVLTVYDSDIADSRGHTNFVLELKNTANNEVVSHDSGDIQVTKGCYVALSGTNPRASLTVRRVAQSDSVVRHYGATRSGPTVTS